MDYIKRSTRSKGIKEGYSGEQGGISQRSALKARWKIRLYGTYET